MDIPGIQKTLENISNSSVDAITKTIVLFCSTVMLFGDKDNDSMSLNIEKVLDLDLSPERAYFCFEIYSMLLTKILVVDDKVIGVQTLQTIEFKKIIDEAKKIVEDMAETHEAITKKFAGKYSNFQPTWHYGELLSTCYEENDDPGKIIGDHIRILFPTSASQDPIEKDTVPPNWGLKININSKTYKHIYELGIWLINNCGYSDELRVAVTIAFESILDPDYIRNNEITDSIDSVLVAVMNTPNDFYNNWFQNCFLSESGITLSQLETVLLYYPIGEGNPSIIKTHPELNGNRSLLHLTLNMTEDKSITWKMFCYICCETLGACDIYVYNENTLKIINNVLANYTSFRRKQCNGISSLDIRDISHVSHLLIENKLNLDGLDILMLLAYGDVYENELSLIDIFGIDKSVTKACQYFNSSFKYYKLMFNKSIDECLYELAAALLAFYLFARGITCNCKFGDLTEIMPLIDFALKMPGSKTLKTTIAHIIGWIDKYYASDPSAQIAKKVFMSYVPMKADLHLISNKRAIKDNDNSAMKWLISEIGEVRIAKLSKQSKEWLLDYWLEWTFHCQEYGFGIKDFSALISKHSKVIEYEIVNYYKDMYFSEEYGSYLAKYKRQRNKQPTLGELLKDLANYKNFTPELKQLLKANTMQLHADKDTVDKLVIFTRNFRNPAAHIEPITIISYSKFVEMFYYDKLLCNFIDTICL